jgi:hypothetical protein
MRQVLTVVQWDMQSPLQIGAFRLKFYSFLLFCNATDYDKGHLSCLQIFGYDDDDDNVVVFVVVVVVVMVVVVLAMIIVGLKTTCYDYFVWLNLTYYDKWFLRSNGSLNLEMDTRRKSATDYDDERKERTPELTREKERKRVSYEEVHRKTEGSRLELTITGFWDGG